MRAAAVVALVLFAGAAAAQTAPAPPAAAVPAVPTCGEMAAALTSLMRNDARLRDWAALGRYREANRQLPMAAPGEARVVFMGDSITDFWQQPRFGRFFEGRPYVDRGISGQTTAQMLVRFRSDVVALAPKAVVILAGVNDIAGNTGPTANEEIEGNIASMADVAHANGVRVVLASIMPVSAYHFQPGSPGSPQTTTRPMPRIAAVNQWLRKYAADHGHEYLDYFSAMVDSSGVLREELSEDDLHPNLKGYEVMGPLAEAAIARALRR